MTPEAQLTKRAVITLVTLSVLVPNSPEKLPQDVSEGFPILKAMKSPALPVTELHTLKAQNIVQREWSEKLALQLKENILKQTPKRLSKVDYIIMTTEQFTESAQEGTAYLQSSPP